MPLTLSIGTGQSERCGSAVGAHMVIRMRLARCYWKTIWRHSTRFCYRRGKAALPLLTQTIQQSKTVFFCSLSEPQKRRLKKCFKKQRVGMPRTFFSAEFLNLFCLPPRQSTPLGRFRGVELLRKFIRQTLGWGEARSWVRLQQGRRACQNPATANAKCIL